MKKYGAIIIKETHRGLWYENGVLTRIVGPGRYDLTPDGGDAPEGKHSWGRNRTEIEVELIPVDMRERGFSIEGLEILTADKAAIQVGVAIQFRVTDPKAAFHEVENYEERLHTDVRLAARRALSSMSLEEILTNDARLGEDVQLSLRETVAHYGVMILRVDVKDLGFPGNLRETMNAALVAEREGHARLVEARTKAQTLQIEAHAEVESRKIKEANGAAG
jgi:regulator of protease activity HflC (stomatin/prohibitin superfamily)